MARTGKIARLPVDIREELNRRLQNGATGPELLPWLNTDPAVLQVLQTHFNGTAINAQNLSDWRNGGYQDWLEKADKTQRVRELAIYAQKLAEANGASIAEGASAIASGRILELLEACDGQMDREELGEIISGLTALRAEETKAERVDIARGRLKQLEEQLALEKKKFQRQTAELFVKWAEDQAAVQVATSGASNSEKIEQLGKMMFGEDW